MGLQGTPGNRFFLLAVGVRTLPGQRVQPGTEAAAVFRTILSKMLTLQESGDPKSFAEVTRKPRGLILFTGLTGLEESTTLGVMMNSIDSTDHAYVLTVEGPVDAVRVHCRPLEENVQYAPEPRAGTTDHFVSHGAAATAEIREHPRTKFCNERWGCRPVCVESGLVTR